MHLHTEVTEINCHSYDISTVMHLMQASKQRAVTPKLWCR